LASKHCARWHGRTLS